MHEHADAAASSARPAVGVVQLDAYPRLCGLPVTVERLVTTSVGATATQTSARAEARGDGSPPRSNPSSEMRKLVDRIRGEVSRRSPWPRKRREADRHPG
jgi:hypothetical protein